MSTQSSNLKTIKHKCQLARLKIHVWHCIHNKKLHVYRKNFKIFFIYVIVMRYPLRSIIEYGPDISDK